MEHALTKYRKANCLTLDDVSRQLSVTRATVCKWEKGRIPAERVLEVERVTGVPRHHLRPDLYPLDEPAA
ncbi:helix-turn-helix domain-containing protein [Stappia sp. F7233]|uniref:Helix-turn-helix domain-containing protein n=1 Tax=Stappia albiluteola TaxID=2758565 RepID=A0A839AIA0_9HYPH|nr:YdaS family helix-turn-helix protein [Stappia albiluteola]MBA5778239.1 helix-turn-helix domain-containing protein [Stappia albiluteola]